MDIARPPSIVKFRTEFVSAAVPADERVSQLAAWCERFAESGLTPRREGTGRTLGNLSFRLREGSPEFVITASTLPAKTGLAPSHFVTVLHSDPVRKVVTAAGTADPSSESMMHYEIYRCRSEVGAIFHGHDPSIVRNARAAGLPETEREQPPGTPELLEEVIRILPAGEFLVMVNHGFLSLGKTMDDAGELALRIRQEIASRQTGERNSV